MGLTSCLSGSVPISISGTPRALILSDIQRVLVRATCKHCFLFERYFWKPPGHLSHQCASQQKTLVDWKWFVSTLDQRSIEPQITRPKILEIPMGISNGHGLEDLKRPNLAYAPRGRPFLYGPARQLQGAGVGPVLKLAQVPTNSMRMWSSAQRGGNDSPSPPPPSDSGSHGQQTARAFFLSPPWPCHACVRLGGAMVACGPPIAEGFPD